MGVRVIESLKQIINRNKEMDEERMQISCTLYFKGSERYRWFFEKGIKQQSLSNAQGWTLNVNWSNKNERRTVDTVSTFFFISDLSRCKNMVRIIEGKII